MDSFSGSGLVLQDIVNQIGHRMGFKVELVVYEGACHFFDRQFEKTIFYLGHQLEHNETATKQAKKN